MDTTLAACSDALALAEAIARRCEDFHPYQDGWRARCPNHQGKSTTSLSVTPQDDRVLLHCHGGCENQAIIHALGLTMADLFVQGRSSQNGHKRIVKEYDYDDASGTLVYQAVRYEPKGFSQQRPDPANPGKFLPNMHGIERVLYHLPQVIGAMQRGETIYVVEGEKDADALQALGLTATCNVGGAGSWKQAYGESLRGADVVILPDNDAPGAKHAEQVAVSLHGIARSVRVVPGLHTEEPHSDVSDWLRQGGSREALDAAVQACPCWTPVVDAPAEQSKTRNPDALPYSDYTNALAFVREHGPTVRYCYPWKSWLVWTETHWERDTSGAVMRMAKQTIKRLAARAADLEDTALKALLAHVKSSLATAKLKAMLESAQSEPGVAVQPEELDTHPWLLNCRNGTLDLQTGTLRPHSKADLLTKCLPIPYDAEARYPLWMEFIERILNGNYELVRFVQRAVGYSLTGSTREQCLFILHGPTKTGKSTFLATLRALLGPYGQQADMSSFMHRDREEVRNDLADLAGSRVVCALESQEGKRLAESLVKQLTGGVDLIKARFLFQEHFTFRPQFKLFLGTNHKPLIRDTDSAIWERIRLIPFVVQIPKPERDKTLEERLQGELSGILAWAVRGCLQWQALGELQEPSAVVDATASYRTEMDTIARFLDECCAKAPEGLPGVKASALASAYLGWCKRTGELPMPNRTFITDMENRGYPRKRGHANQYYWYGIGLANTDDDHTT